MATIKKHKLTYSQAETLLEWLEATESEQYYLIHDVFSARDNVDNGRRRVMFSLRDKGLLCTQNGKVRGGQALFSQVAKPPNQYDPRYDCLFPY